jgi:hypothetical protein
MCCCSVRLSFIQRFQRTNPCSLSRF